MENAWISIGLAFIEGFALIISPCILPILPIILAGSITGNKSRPLGIITGFIITFTIVTLFSKAIIALFDLNPNTLRNVSFVLLFMLGVVMMSTYLTEKFNLATQRLTRIGSSLDSVNNPQSGFLSGLVFGGLVGIIWTPCAGPVLAAVIVQIVIQQTTFSSILIIVSFAIGAGVPMLLIALIGRRLLDKFSFVSTHADLFRKLLGLIIIASVVLLFITSGGVSSYTESNTISSKSSVSASSTLTLINGLDTPYKAPEITGIDAWINSPPLHLNQLINKVVLIDFWTYTCINCIRTLPYVKDWYAKYHDKGLVIIGIHSPEFEFEHNLDNVKNAVKKFGILYPVALDNNFVTWRNYHNQYWPAHYLINKEGNVVYVHFGEGEYDVTENNIRYLLGLPMAVAATIEENVALKSQTPETYLGYKRTKSFASPEKIIKNQPTIYSYPKVLPKDKWALKGNWVIDAEKIVAASAGASIKLNFTSKNVYAVMGAPSNKINLKLLLNGELVIEQKGEDVFNSQVIVSNNQLYSLIHSNSQNEGLLELIVMSPGLEIYTFTFG